MANDIATAFIKVQPNLAGFKTALSNGVTAAVKAINDNPPKVAVGLKIAPGEIKTLRDRITGITNLGVPVVPTLSRAGKTAVVQELGNIAPTSVPVNVVTKSGEPVSTKVIPDFRGFLTAMREGIKAPVARFNENPPNLLVGFRIAAGAIPALREQVAQIPNLVVGVIPRVGSVGRAALKQELADLPPQVIKVTGKAVPPTGGVGGGAGGAADELVEGNDAVAASSKQAQQVLANEAKIAFRVSTAEQQLADDTLTLAEKKEALRLANIAANQSENLLQTALAKGNIQTIRRAAALAKAGEKAHEALDLQVKDLVALSEAQKGVAFGGGGGNFPSNPVAAAAAAKQIAAQQKLNDALVAGSDITNRVDAARARLTASNKAVVASQEAVTAAAKVNVPILIFQARATERLALEEQALAKASLEAAAAQELHGRQLRTGAKGALSSTLGFLGLRGAVLAASAPFLIGAASIAAFSKSLAQATKLEDTLATFGAVTNATKGQLEAVRAAAVALGKDISLPGVSAGDAADAMLQLSKAGLSVQNSIAGARGVLQLASAAAITNADATNLAATALNAFSLSGDEASHVADVFANAAKSSQGEITDFGTAMQQVAAVSSQVGVSLEDTTALLTILARQGLRGSDAGTSLRTAFLRLVAPTNQAREVIQNLGLQVRDTEGNLRPDIFAQFAEATKGFSRDVSDAFASIIFGQDAIRAATLAGREGVSGLNDARDAINEQGTAAAIAAAKAKTLSGQVAALSSNLETLGASIGHASTPLVSVLVKGLNAAVTTLNGIPDAVDRDIEAFRRLKKSFDDLGGTSLGEFFGGIAKSLSIVIPALGGGGDKVTSTTEELQKKLSDLQRKIHSFGDERELIPPEWLQQEQELSLALAKSQGQIVQNTKALQERALGLQASARQLSQGLHAQAVEQRVGVLRTQLQNALAAVKQFGEDSTSEAAVAARDNVQNILDQLKNLKGGGKVIEEQGADLAHFLGVGIRQGLADFTGVKELVEQNLGSDILLAIDRLKRLKVPEAKKELEAIGKILRKALNDGLSDQTEKDKAVADARQAVNDAIEASRDAVANAVSQGRTNLEQFGTSVADAIGKALTAPIDAQIKEIDKKLDAFEERTSRRSLKFDLSQAQQELSTVRKTLVTVGPPNAAQRAQIAKALAPLQEGVSKAQDALTKFNLEDKKDDLNDTKKAFEDAAKNGVQKLVDQFLDGKLSAQQFADKLNNQVRPALEKLKTKAGENLGLSFSRQFKADVKNLIDQAQFLVGFLSTPEPSKAVSPGKVASQQKSQVDKARESLQKAIDAQKETRDNTSAKGPIVKALHEVEKAIESLKPKPKGKSTPPKPGKGDSAPRGTAEEPNPAGSLNP